MSVLKGQIQAGSTLLPLITLLSLSVPSSESTLGYTGWCLGRIAAVIRLFRALCNIRNLFLGFTPFLNLLLDDKKYFFVF